MNADLVAQHALTHLAKAGAGGLAEVEKTVAAVWLFAAGVGNNGFTGYYRSTRGDLAFHAPEALAAIGAHQLAEIAAQANFVFGANGPPADRQLRRECVRKMSQEDRRRLAQLEERYFTCEEDIDELLEAYLAGHTVSA